MINIQKSLEYLEGGKEFIPKSSPLQGMKAQLLQSLFVVVLAVFGLFRVVCLIMKIALLIL